MIARLRSAGSVFAEDEADLLLAEDFSGTALEAAIRRRLRGKPLEQIVGWALFCGLRIRVETGVFVPRRRTELMVATAVEAAPPGGHVLDLCCGTGAIGAAVLAARSDITVSAADCDAMLAHCARRNLPRGTEIACESVLAAESAGLTVSLRSDESLDATVIVASRH